MPRGKGNGGKTPRRKKSSDDAYFMDDGSLRVGSKLVAAIARALRKSQSEGTPFTVNFGCPPTQTTCG